MCWGIGWDRNYDPEASRRVFRRNYYYRKGMYAIPVQAVADAKYRFLYMSARCSGSSHDSVTFIVSELAHSLSSTSLLPGYSIAADRAYTGENGLIKPWSASALYGKSGLSCDAFNFYHSSHCMHVEQALGVPVRRWAIFRQSLAFRLAAVPHTISAAMRLHNYAIEQDGIGATSTFASLENEQIAEAAFRVWQNTATSLRTNPERESHRRDSRSLNCARN